ncbi:MAG: 6-bladed beta-propeller [Gemmatimonadaceae bacterium]
MARARDRAADIDSVLFTLMAAALIACTASEARQLPRPGGAASQRPADASAWTVVEEQRYGSTDEGRAALVEANTLGVDGAGRLYVADTKPVVIMVFNTDGTLLRTIGRQGGGPGEYRNPWIAVRGANLVVHDPAPSRTSVFDTSGTYLRSWQSFCCHQNEMAIDNANRVVVRFRTGCDRQGWIRRSACSGGMVGDGPARQAVRLQDVPRSEPAFTRLLVDEDGNIWARRLLGGDATHTVFDVFAANGDYLGEARMPVVLPEWGGAYFGKGVVYVRSEDDEGGPSWCGCV